PCGLPRPPGNASAIQTPPKVAASFQLKANANIAVSFQLKKTPILLKPMSPPLARSRVQLFHFLPNIK
ncbi:hypothetical protein, partial [Kluyvera cryocrescens]|uniref:hypothetical protein n=1 Tax=Kluyvera cryocrescens TaxID=580 RepID=UPI00248AA908